MRRFISFTVFSIMAMAVAACQPPGQPEYADITFDHLPPIELDVAEIIIKTPYQEPLAPPHVGEQFPVSPSRATRRWAEDRLRATGERGTATVTVIDSSAVEAELERTTGVTGLFTKDQAQSYEVTIEMSIEVMDPVGPRTGSASVRTTKKTSVAEDASLNERVDTWHKLTQDAMKNFNEAMDKQIGNTLSGFRK